MKTIYINCGIYDTEYTLTAHRDGSITVKAPYINWANNTGTLAFQKVSFPAGPLADKIKRAFADRDLFLPGYEAATIQDAVDGYLS
jgi:hypothetical protein